MLFCNGAFEQQSCFLVAVLTMADFEFHLQTAVWLALLWRREPGTLHYDPSLSCSKHNNQELCKASGHSRANITEHWMTQDGAVAAFPKNFPDVAALIQQLGEGDYAGMLEAIKKFKPDQRNTQKCSADYSSKEVELKWTIGTCLWF